MCFLVAWVVKNPLAMWEAWVQSLGWEDPLEEGMAADSSILAQGIPMDRGAWWDTVHGLSKSQTEWASRAHTSYPDSTRVSTQNSKGRHGHALFITWLWRAHSIGVPRSPNPSRKSCISHLHRVSGYTCSGGIVRPFHGFPASPEPTRNSDTQPTRGLSWKHLVLRLKGNLHISYTYQDITVYSSPEFWSVSYKRNS